MVVEEAAASEGMFFVCPACGRRVDPSADHAAVFAEKEQAVAAMPGSRDYAPDAAWFHPGCWPNPFYRRRPRPDGAPPTETMWDALEPRTLWFPFSLLVLFGAVVLAFYGWIFRQLDCHEDVSSPCSTSSLVQEAIAFAGLVPVLGMMISSLLHRGRPGLWFLATVSVYGIWLLYLWVAMGFF